MFEVPRKVIPKEDLAHIRQVADSYFHDNFDGEVRTMRVVFTTHELVRTVIQGGPGAPALVPPDDRPLYLVVLEGDFRRRVGPPATGQWMTIRILPTMVARSHQGPAEPGTPVTDRVIGLDLSELGLVHDITDL